MKTFKRISALCLTLLLSCQLGACSSKQAYSESEIESTVNTAFESLSKFENPSDVDSKFSADYLSLIVTYAQKYPQVKKLAQEIFSSLKWEVTSVDTKSSSAKIKITNKDFYEKAKIFLDAEKKENTGKTLKELFGSETWMNSELKKAEYLINSTKKTKTSEIYVTVSEVAGVKKVQLSQDGSDAVTGGITKAIKEVFLDPLSSKSGKSSD